MQLMLKQEWLVPIVRADLLLHQIPNSKCVFGNTCALGSRQKNEECSATREYFALIGSDGSRATALAAKTRGTRQIWSYGRSCRKQIDIRNIMNIQKLLLEYHSNQHEIINKSIIAVSPTRWVVDNRHRHGITSTDSCYHGDKVLHKRKFAASHSSSGDKHKKSSTFVNRTNLYVPILFDGKTTTNDMHAAKMPRSRVDTNLNRPKSSK